MPGTAMAAKAEKQGLHQNSLVDDLVATGPLRTKSKKRKARRDEDAEEGYVDSKSSRKILKIGRELAEEDQIEAKQALPNQAFTFESRFPEEDESDEEPQQYDEGSWSDMEGNIEEVVGL